MEKLVKGTQIVCIPDHAHGDVYHPDSEYGFVTSTTNDAAFCRYWNKKGDDLRTKANSELTPLRNIVVVKSKPQELVDRIIEEMDL